MRKKSENGWRENPDPTKRGNHTPCEELDAIIAAGWGDTPWRDVPKDWREAGVIAIVRWKMKNNPRPIASVGWSRKRAAARAAAKRSAA